MANRKLVIEVVGDASKLDKTFKQAQSSTTKFGKSLDGLNAGATGSARGLGAMSAALRSGGIALGLGVATRTAIDFAEAASDLNEQVSKSKQVFGESSKEIEKWAGTTAKSIGISRRAALEAAGTFGNLFSTVGVQGNRAADLSRELVRLAADLASFNNADPSEVLDALRSGLIGEAEPLRRFGVLLSEARVQQQAMTDTGKTTAKALTDQEKVTARYELILRDTAKAQGDFARTSGSLANQQRILGAQIEDNKATIGSVFLPIVKAVVTGLNEIPEKVAKVGDSARDADDKTHGFFSGTISALGDAAGKVDDFGQSIRGLVSPFADISHAFGDVNAAAKQFEATLQGIIDLNPGGAVDIAAGIAAANAAAAKAAADKKKPPSFGEPGFKPGTAPPVPTGPTADQRNRFFDDKIQRALFRSEDLTPQQQVAELARIAKLIEARIAITKDITRKLNLEDQLISVNRQRKSVLEAISEQAAEDARKAAEKAKEARDAAKKQKDTLAEAAKAVVEGVTGFRSRIKDAVKKANEGGPETETTQLNTKKILAGLGLSPADERELRQRLSVFNSAGVALAGRGGQAGGQAIHVTVQAPDVFMDRDKVSTGVRRSNTVHARRNPKQKRGSRF